MLQDQPSPYGSQRPARQPTISRINANLSVISKQKRPRLLQAERATLHGGTIRPNITSLLYCCWDLQRTAFARFTSPSWISKSTYSCQMPGNSLPNLSAASLKAREEKRSKERTKRLRTLPHGEKKANSETHVAATNSEADVEATNKTSRPQGWPRNTRRDAGSPQAADTNESHSRWYTSRWETSASEGKGFVCVCVCEGESLCRMIWGGDPEAIRCLL